MNRRTFLASLAAVFAALLALLRRRVRQELPIIGFDPGGSGEDGTAIVCGRIDARGELYIDKIDVSFLTVGPNGERVRVWR